MGQMSVGPRDGDSIRFGRGTRSRGWGGKGVEAKGVRELKRGFFR